VAQAFRGTRAGGTYEVRGEAMAADLADGTGPPVVARFRQAILDLRRTPNLAGELYKRMDSVYAKVLPGYEPGQSKAPGVVYMVLGPDKQLDAYEAYLKSAVGPAAGLHRLYPRDFWLVADVDNAH